MPTRLTIPERQQFGVGLFESHAAFNGYAALRWAWPAAFNDLWPTIDLGLTEGFTALPDLGGGGLTVQPNLFTLAGQQAFVNITKGLTHTQHAKAAEYVQRAFVLNGIGESIERVAVDVLETKKDTARKLKPRTIIRYIKPTLKANLKPLQKRVAEAEARARAAEKREKALEHRIAVLERKVKAQKPAAVPIAAPHPPINVPGWGEITSRLRNPAKWIGLAAFLALLTKALEKIGGSYIRCSNTKRYGRHLCGMDYNLLESLIADTLLVAATIDLVEFAKSVNAMTDWAAQSILWFTQIEKQRPPLSIDIP